MKENDSHHPAKPVAAFDRQVELINEIIQLFLINF